MGETSGEPPDFAVKFHSERTSGEVVEKLPGKFGELLGKSGDFPEARGSLTPSQRLAKFVSKYHGHIRGISGKSLANFWGTPGLLLKSTVREVPEKSARNFWGSLEFPEGSGKSDSLPATRENESPIYAGTVSDLFRRVFFSFLSPLLAAPLPPFVSAPFALLFPSENVAGTLRLSAELFSTAVWKFPIPPTLVLSQKYCRTNAR